MFLNRIATNIHVSDAYLAPPIHTPVSLFLATDHTENSYLIDVEAWRKVALGGVEAIYCPGNHLNLVRETEAVDRRDGAGRQTIRPVLTADRSR